MSRSPLNPRKPLLPHRIHHFRKEVIHHESFLGNVITQILPVIISICELIILGAVILLRALLSVLIHVEMKSQH